MVGKRYFEINKNGVDNSLRYYLCTDRYDIKDKTSMLKKALKYFAKKYLKEIGAYDQCSFWEMSCYVADILCVSACELQRWYRGMSHEDNILQRPLALILLEFMKTDNTSSKISLTSRAKALRNKKEYDQERINCSTCKCK